MVLSRSVSLEDKIKTYISYTSQELKHKFYIIVISSITSAPAADLAPAQTTTSEF